MADYTSTRLSATFLRFEDTGQYDPRTGRPQRRRIVMRQPSADFDVINVDDDALAAAGLAEDELAPCIAAKLDGVRAAELDVRFNAQYAQYEVRKSEAITF